MGIKIFLDDIRPAPEGWIRTFTAWETIAFLKAGKVDEISLDHDLGEGTYGTNDDPGSGRDVVLWLAEHGGFPLVIKIHSRNPVGAKWMFDMCLRYAPRGTTTIRV